MFDALPFPGVGDVHQAVTGLNYRRIRIFARLVFEDERGLPAVAVFGDGDIQRRAAVRRMIVNQQGASVFQHDRVDGAVRIRQRRRSYRTPTFPAVAHPALKDFTLFGATEHLRFARRPLQDGRLNEA